MWVSFVKDILGTASSIKEFFFMQSGSLLQSHIWEGSMSFFGTHCANADVNR